MFRWRKNPRKSKQLPPEPLESWLPEGLILGHIYTKANCLHAPLAPWRREGEKFCSEPFGVGFACCALKDGHKCKTHVAGFPDRSSIYVAWRI